MDKNAPYEQLGKEEGIRTLVDTFYDYMDALPEAKGIRDLHAKRLDSSREKLYLFLVGWCGGPPLYVEKYGHPRLRARHLPFPIGASERDQWMLCMNKALEDCVADLPLRQFLAQKFYDLADFMRNKPEGCKGALQQFVDAGTGSDSE